MIFMLFNLVWGLTYQMKRNFEHLVQKTRPRMCARIVLKFYKKQMKSENLKIFHDIMISYAVWNEPGFRKDNPTPYIGVIVPGSVAITYRIHLRQ